MGMNASEKPDLVGYFASLTRQAQTQLENSPPHSIVFIVKDSKKDKIEVIVVAKINFPMNGLKFSQLKKK